MMKKITLLISCLAVLLIFIFCSRRNYQEDHLDYMKTDSSIDYKELLNGFKNPPPQARMRSFWKWPNSLATKESITRDLEEFKDKGWGGMIINDGANSSNSMINQNPPWDATGPLYLSAEWKELYQHAVKEADRVGLEITSVMGSGWNPGGPAITPEYAVKKLVFTEIEIKGGELVQIQLPVPDTLLMYKDVKIQAIRNQKKDVPTKNEAISNWSLKTLNRGYGTQGNYPFHLQKDYEKDYEKANIIKKDDIVDVTSFFDGKQLSWDAPEGDWLIIRYGWTCKGTRTSTTSKGWGGLSMDHLNPDAFKLFSDSVIMPIVETVQSAGNSVKYLWTDSWEMGVTNWTNNFPDEFKKFRGYELDEFLPILAGRVVENQDITNRFLRDFRETVSDCILENHYRLFKNLANQHGFGFHPESGGPHAAPIDAMRVMGVTDFPMGEFWLRANTHRVTDAARFFVQQAGSVAHTNGQRLVGAEGPQTIGPMWERAPKDMKHDLDRAFCSGVNRLFWTSSISSPQEFGVPGIGNFAGNLLNPTLTWWEQQGDFVQYINRCSFMLQQGLFVADVLYYYGDDVPNFVFLKEEYPELQFGYNWDKCSKDVILERASVSDGKIVLSDGMSYQVLVLTPEDAINLDVLKKVEQLVKEGATIVSPRPQRTTGLSDYPSSDEELQKIVSRMWGNIDGERIKENAYGKGSVVWGKNINEVLSSKGVIPDFSFRSKNEHTALDFIHRTMDAQDAYYVVNRFAHHGINDFRFHDITTQPDRYEEVECSFRVTGKIPELWDPITGEITKPGTYREENGQTIIPLHLGPEASVFVVFREGKSEKHIVKIEKNGNNIFPLENMENAEVISNPAINIYSKRNDLVADIFVNGNYTLYYSNGKQIQINVDQTGEEVEITSPWQVLFDPEWGGPADTTFTKLKSWLEFDDPGIKYYSGKATYMNNFTLSRQDYKGKKVFLDLGNVQELGVVRLNGHAFPVIWMPPFRVEITEYLTNGENELEVDVINQWPNRLIGDSKLPEEERFAKTNYLKFYQPDSEKYLRESGLIGPAKLQFVSSNKLD